MIRALQHVLPTAVAAMILGGCVSATSESTESIDTDTVVVLSAVEAEPPREPRPGDEDFRFNDPHALKEYIGSDSVAPVYEGGIMPVIAEEVPKYADRLLGNQHDGFLVVDKASMRVILYDTYGHERRAYDMACAKNFGDKHEKGDSRTPEGFFSVQGVYDSTDWLFTDDNGVQSPKKGQFGPRFIRIKIPTTSQIGIHGTCAPWSIGHRSSHGCIRLTNENILELVELVEPGMPVIILPGKRDRAANREEGHQVPYFPTAPKYAMTEAEKKLPIKEKKSDKEAEKEPEAVETTVVTEEPAPAHPGEEEPEEVAPDPSLPEDPSIYM